MPLKRSAAMSRKDRPEVAKRDSSSSSEAEAERVVEATKELSKRARLARTSTMEKVRRLEEDWQQKHTLFDNALLVTINDVIDSGKQAHIRKPVVSYSFRDDDQSCHIPAELIFPDYSHSLLDINREEPLVKVNVNEEYIVSLTDGMGHRKNAYCIKFVINDDNEGPSTSPAVFAIISPMKNSNFYLEMARMAVNYYKINPVRMKSFLKSIYRHQYATLMKKLFIHERGPNGNERILTIENNQTHSKGYAGTCQMVKRISPEFMTCIIAALLSEQRVLITGNSIRATTQAVQTAETMLRPLVWPHTFVPIIPDNLVDLCHNPTPFLMGILRKNLSLIHDLIASKNVVEEDTFKENFVLFDVDNGMVVPPPLPYSDNLKPSEWRTLSALAFCESKAMPRRIALNLMDNLTQACLQNSDDAVQKAMLKWYSKLFGHYRHLDCHLQWDEGAKSKLIEHHKSKTYSKYLGFLTETILFDEWIKQRVNFLNTKIEKNIENHEEEEQSRIVAKIWEDKQNNQERRSDKKTFGRMFNKVGNVFHFMRTSIRK